MLNNKNNEINFECAVRSFASIQVFICTAPKKCCRSRNTNRQSLLITTYEHTNVHNFCLMAQLSPSLFLIIIFSSSYSSPYPTPQGTNTSSFSFPLPVPLTSPRALSLLRKALRSPQTPSFFPTVPSPPKTGSGREASRPKVLKMTPKKPPEVLKKSATLGLMKLARPTDRTRQGTIHRDRSCKAQLGNDWCPSPHGALRLGMRASAQVDLDPVTSKVGVRATADLRDFEHEKFSA